MTTYNCKIVVLSTCAFENTPIIYEYVEKHSGIITYIDTSKFLLIHKKNNINVEIKQISTSIHMLEFIKINVAHADFIVIFDSIGIIPDFIFELVRSKPQLKIDDRSNYKNVINNKIFNLMELDVFHQVELDEQIQIDDRITTIFGKTNNQRLIRINNWLDKWLFCYC